MNGCSTEHEFPFALMFIQNTYPYPKNPHMKNVSVLANVYIFCQLVFNKTFLLCSDYLYHSLCLKHNMGVRITSFERRTLFFWRTKFDKTEPFSNRRYDKAGRERLSPI